MKSTCKNLPYPTIFYFTIGYGKVEYSSHRVWWGKEEKSKFKL